MKMLRRVRLPLDPLVSPAGIRPAMSFTIARIECDHLEVSAGIEPTGIPALALLVHEALHCLEQRQRPWVVADLRFDVCAALAGDVVPVLTFGVAIAFDLVCLDLIDLALPV